MEMEVFKMPRNKYPEITEQRILDAATKLFLEKGCDETTIQDIIDEIGDLTRGAFYHHFKSKEDIIDAVSKRLFIDNNPFENVRYITGLNGLEKLRAVFMMSYFDTRQLQFSKSALYVMKSPQIIARQVQTCVEVLAPYIEKLFKKG